MHHAAFGACELGRQLRRKKVQQKIDEDDSGLVKILPRSSFNSMKRKSDQKPLLMEMLQTERLYVDSLHAVVSRYMLPLQVTLDNYQEPIMSKQDLSKIFGNIAQIFEVNIELLRIIEENIKSTDDDSEMATAFAKAFTNMLPVFKAFYSVYANNYERGIDTLEECRLKSPVLEKFLAASARHKDCKGLDLSDFLIKPVQRICKYPLFFRGLLDCTKESHPMHCKLREAAEAVNKIAQQVNQTAIENETTMRSFQIGARLEGLKVYDPELQVVSPGRKFLMEFQCKLHYSFQTPGAKPNKKMSHAPRQKKPRECFLFNDVLLLTKGLANDRLEFRFWLDLHDVLVSIPPSHSAASADSIEDGGFSLGQKRLPLDIVRIKVMNTDNTQKATRFIDDNAEANNSVSSEEDSDKQHIRKGSLPVEMSVVEKYTLWFKNSSERSKVYNLIVSLQSDLEKQKQDRHAHIKNNHSPESLCSKTVCDDENIFTTITA